MMAPSPFEFVMAWGGGVVGDFPSWHELIWKGAWTKASSKGFLLACFFGRPLALERSLNQGRMECMGGTSTLPSLDAQVVPHGMPRWRPGWLGFMKFDWVDFSWIWTQLIT